MTRTPALKQCLTDVDGIAVGHFTEQRRPTGCTVVLARGGAVCGVDVRGAAPGTRETDLLTPGNLVDKVHAVLLAGGSAYGLDAASGVMRWLEENDIGLAVGPHPQDAAKRLRVPIVPAAVLYDLWLGDGRIRPDAQAGYAACAAAAQAAGSAAGARGNVGESSAAAPTRRNVGESSAAAPTWGNVGESSAAAPTWGNVGESSAAAPTWGNVGAGAGASVGKLFGTARAMKGGLGSASLRLHGITVAALIACNAAGDVVDPQTTALLAGARLAEGGRALLDTRQALLRGDLPTPLLAGTNTTIGVIATDALLDPAQAKKLAQLGHDGLARSINPVHSLLDGDTLFALATGAAGHSPSPLLLGVMAAEVVARAVANAVRAAQGVRIVQPGGAPQWLPGCADRQGQAGS